MDKNTITGIILIFAIFIGFSIYNNRSNEEKSQDKMLGAEIKRIFSQMVNYKKRSNYVK